MGRVSHQSWTSHLRDAVPAVGLRDGGHARDLEVGRKVGKQVGVEDDLTETGIHLVLDVSGNEVQGSGSSGTDVGADGKGSLDGGTRPVGTAVDGAAMLGPLDEALVLVGRQELPSQELRLEKGQTR